MRKQIEHGAYVAVNCACKECTAMCDLVTWNATCDAAHVPEDAVELVSETVAVSEVVVVLVAAGQ